MKKYLPALFLLCTTFSALAGDSNEHWLEVQTPHFTVITNSGEKQARHIAGQFEQMRAVFHILMSNGTADTGSPIVVLALKDKKSFQSLEPASYLSKGQLSLAGLFLPTPDKNYILLRLDAEGEHPFATVYHEYTHLMVSKATWLPLWLNEGQVDHSSPYYHDEQKGSVFYSESWALTHFIEVTDHEKNTSRLADYARFLSVQQEDPVTAAQHAFGDLNKLQKELEGYIRQGDYKKFKMTAALTVDPAAFPLRPITKSEADATRAEVLVYDDRPREAEALLTTTLADDPSNALAHEVMGTLKLHDHDPAAAKKWYGEAVQLDSKSFLANYYYASMSMQTGDRDHDDAIESSFLTAIKLNPSFAPSYDTLAMFYASRHKKLDQAHLLNVHALMLEPQNVNYRLNAATVLMEEEQLPSALNVLKLAAPIAKTPFEVTMVQSRIDQLEQYQSSLEHAQTQRRQYSETAQTSTVQTMVPSGPAPSGGTKVMVFRRVNGQTIGRAEDPPNYPTGDATGARHVIHGILRNISCANPTVITLTVDQAGKPITLYNNDYFKIVFTTANYEPEGDIKPCTGIEDMKATVKYAEVANKDVAGQILSIELSK